MNKFLQTKFSFINIFIFLIFNLLIGCSSVSKEKLNIKIKAYFIYEIPENVKLKPFSVVHNFFFNNQVNKVAFIAGDKGKEFIVTSFKQNHEEFDSIRNINFSPDGKHLVYNANKNGKSYIIINGQKKEGLGWSLLFTPKGKLVFVDGEGCNKDKQNNVFYCKKYFLNLDGKRGEKFDWINYVKFDETGDNYAYVAGENCSYPKFPISCEKYYVIHNGKKTESFEWVDSNSIKLIPKTNKVIFKAGKECQNDFDYSHPCKKEFVVVDGNMQEEFKTIGIISISPDGKRIAYPAENVKENFIVIDGKKNIISGPSWLINFSHDNKSITYSINERFNYNRFSTYVIRDNEKYGPYATVQGLQFSTDNKNLVYFTENSFYQDGIIKDTFEDISLLQQPKFNYNGSKVAYIAGSNCNKEKTGCLVFTVCSMQFIVLNGEKKKEYEQISNALFAPNSENIVYVAENNCKAPYRFRKTCENKIGVINDKEIGEYNYISQITENNFINNKLIFGAVKNKKIYRVEVSF